MIKPTVGRVVWYRPARSDPWFGSEPLAAMVSKVWGDSLVNLVVFDPNGAPMSKTSVPLRQDNDEAPSIAYCEWMPYQKGQAAKTEQLEAAARSEVASGTAK